MAPDRVTYAEIAAAHAELASTPSAANHLVRTLRAMFSWAKDSRLLAFKSGNPARGHRRYRETPKDRILTVPEIRTLIAKLLETAIESADSRHHGAADLLTLKRTALVQGTRGRA